MESQKGESSSLIVYIDDNDERKEVWVTLQSVKDGFVTFLTQSKDNHKNTISIPISRVLKIKTKGGDDESATDVL